MSVNIKDNILGMIFGQALGDAYGLSVEFKTKEWIEFQYPNKEIPFYDYIETSHNKRWKRGDWTDDTDQMICIMRSLTEKKEVDVIDIAKRLKEWKEGGLKECGDRVGMGIGETTLAVMSHPYFCINPKEVSKQVYKLRGDSTASNGALMRTSIVSSFLYLSSNEVINNAIDIASITHSNPKCIASCIYACIILMSIFQCVKLNTQFNPAIIMEYAMTQSCKVFQTEEEINEFKHWCTYTSPEKCNFDKNGIGYTYLCLKAFIYGMNVIINDTSYETASEGFKKAIHRCIRQGGDADTNGAVCGAIMGARIGYSNLPKDWIDKLPHKDLLMNWAYEYLKSINEV